MILKAQLDIDLGKKFIYIELALDFKTSDFGHGPTFGNVLSVENQSLIERNTHHLFYMETDFKIQIVHW